MAWVVDGSNVLGIMGLDRFSEDAKRELTRLCASFARAKKSRITCYFDGPEPASFARHLGNATIVFSGARAADDLIVERIGSGRGWNVVTADRQLAARIAGRSVTVVEPREFVKQLHALEREPESGKDEEWLEWFSDPSNREKF